MRVAFTMKLKAGCQAEYRRRHDEIWPELAAVLKEAGISDYSIFLDEPTMTLFAVQQQSSPEAAAALPENEVVRRWWKSMAPLMVSNPDGSPKTGPLKEVFHLP